jgi:ribosome-binding factor A
MTRRVERVNSLLVEVIAEVVMREVKDPRIPGLITITRVEISPDLRQAKVFFSVIGDEKTKKLTLQILQEAAGYIAITASKKVVLKYFPQLTFKIDDTLEKHQRIDDLLKKIEDEKNARSPESSDGT